MMISSLKYPLSTVSTPVVPESQRSWFPMTWCLWKNDTFLFTHRTLVDAENGVFTGDWVGAGERNRKPSIIDRLRASL